MSHNNQRKISNAHVLDTNNLGKLNEMQSLVSSWLTDDNITWAKGKNLKDVIERFGNTLEPIAILPKAVVDNVPFLDNNCVYCGKAYLIDHHANHHPEINVNEYKFIQEILETYDDIKDVSDDNNIKYAFVKRIHKSYAVVVQFSKENNGIILYKTFFYRDSTGKRIPYEKKKSIMEK